MWGRDGHSERDQADAVECETALYRITHGPSELVRYPFADTAVKFVGDALRHDSEFRVTRHCTLESVDVSCIFLKRFGLAVEPGIETHDYFARQ